MKTFIAISELILAAAATVIFLKVRSFLNKHENEDMAQHREYFRKMVYSMMIVGILIISLSAIYLVIS